MSGHSKWATTHRQKESADAKRGAIFTKIANQITIAAREGGGNPESNFKLRLVMDKARAANMPNDNVDRAIKRGTGELAGNKLEEAVYEAMGPANTAIIIEVLTDNKNRILANIKKTLSTHGGRLAESGSLAWQFKRLGVLTIDAAKLQDNPAKKEEIELALMDLGVEDYQWQDDLLVVYTKNESLASTKQGLEKIGLIIKEGGIELIPQNKVILNEESDKNKLQDIFDELDDNPEVNNYYSNAEF